MESVTSYKVVLCVLCSLNLCFVLSQNYDIPKDSFASSTIAMVRLLQEENHILSIFKNNLARNPIIDSRYIELAGLLQKVENLASVKPPNPSTEYLEDFYGHPINAFHVIKAWAAISDFMDKESNFMPAIDSKAEMALYNQSISTRTDVKAMTHCLLRLQTTYGLSTADLARGNVAGFQAMAPLSAADCVLVGFSTYETKLYSAARSWMELVKNNPVLYDGLDSTQKRDLHFVIYQIDKHDGLYDEAEKELERAYDAVPADAFIRTELTTYKQELFRGDMAPYRLPGPIAVDYDVPAYHRLCRAPIQRKFPYGFMHGFCRYTGTHPYIRYKQEIHNIDPWVSFFHDVITDYEIQVLRGIATAKLSRSLVYHTEDLFLTRTSSTAWVFDNRAEVRRISQKVADMTQLAIKTMGDDIMQWILDGSTAEAFQILNYGFGGHYSPHTDTIKNAIHDVTVVGDRVATFMFYLSHVKAGGATVFPKLGVRIPPQKGGAAFWFNLRKSGRLYEDTLHAGCPVLIGHKWVANKWVREKGQLFKRPCGESELARDDFKL